MSGDAQFVTGDDPLMAGTWWPFPPPTVGYYNIRRVATETTFSYFPDRRVFNEGQHLKCLGRRVSRMPASAGWQFQFLAAALAFRPFVVVYASGWAPGQSMLKPEGQILEERDVSDQLPIARSVEEARYIIGILPIRFPVFHHLHVKYIEEKKDVSTKEA